MNRQNEFKYLWTIVWATELEQAVLEVVEQFSGQVYRTIELVPSLYFIDGKRIISRLRTGEFFATVDLRGGDILFWSKSIIRSVFDQMYMNAQHERDEWTRDTADWWKNA